MANNSLKNSFFLLYTISCIIPNRVFEQEDEEETKQCQLQIQADRDRNRVSNSLVLEILRILRLFCHLRENVDKKRSFPILSTFFYITAT